MSIHLVCFIRTKLTKITKNNKPILSREKAVVEIYEIVVFHYSRKPPFSQEQTNPEPVTSICLWELTRQIKLDKLPAVTVLNTSWFLNISLN